MSWKKPNIESIDLDEEDLEASEAFPRLTRANYVDRVRFDSRAQ